MSEHPIEPRDVSREVGPPVRGEIYPSYEGRTEFGTPEEPEGPGLGRYLAAVLRYKWLILLATALGALAGVFLAKSIPNEYRAQATLWIESAPRQQSTLQPIRSAEVLDSQGWAALLASYSVLEPVVWQQRLYLRTDKPASAEVTSTLAATDSFRPGGYRLEIDEAGRSYVLATGSGAELERGAVGDSIGRSIGVQWLPPAGSLQPEEEVEFALLAIRESAQMLAAQLEMSPGRDQTFIALALTGTDARKTAVTVNAIAEQYLQVAAELKLARVRELSEILGEQLRIAEGRLLQAESALQDFQVSTITESPVAGGAATGGGAQDPVAADFFRMRLDREQVQRDRQAIRRVLEAARTSPLSVFAMEAIPSVDAAPSLQSALTELTTRRAELRTLRQRYTDEMPEVIRLQQVVDELEDRTIPAFAASLLDQLASRENELGKQLATASTALQQIPGRSIELARRQRTFENAERIYTLLQGRYEEARLAAVSSMPDVRSLDNATVPQWPTNSGARTQMMLIALLGSLGLAVGGAILMDRFDPKVRYPDQVTGGMGLPILGAVPFVRAAEQAKSAEESRHAIEAFREIRLNTVHSAGDRAPLAFTVTSAEEGDGKSFVSSNLALAFAQQGHRTLLIDGDIRRGRLHHFLKGVRTPGLSDLLSNHVTLEQVVQSTDVPLVSLIASGTRMHVGPELLGSLAMKNYLAELRRQFDVIIVDTPPLGAGVDPYVLGTMTGNLLLVVRTGNTNRAFAEAKLKLMDRLPVRILGAILNGIPADQRVYRYYSYLPNYGAREEITEEATGRRLAAIDG